MRQERREFNNLAWKVRSLPQFGLGPRKCLLLIPLLWILCIVTVFKARATSDLTNRGDSKEILSDAARRLARRESAEQRPHRLLSPEEQSILKQYPISPAFCDIYPVYPFLLVIVTSRVTGTWTKRDKTVMAEQRAPGIFLSATLVEYIGKDVFLTGSKGLFFAKQNQFISLLQGIHALPVRALQSRFAATLGHVQSWIKSVSVAVCSRKPWPMGLQSAHIYGPRLALTQISKPYKIQRRLFMKLVRHRETWQYMTLSS